MAKENPSPLLLIAVMALILIGCQNNNAPQRTGYNTIASLELAASTAIDQYDKGVINGTIPKNSVPQVTLRFNQFQAAAKVAADTDKAGTNGLAPDYLNSELNDLTSLIATFTPTK